jgi:tRNA threonylcarbamoyl adenosine modification protein YeaZ
MLYFLSIQNNYHQVELALFKDSHILTSLAISKIDASSQLMLTIKSLLAEHHLSFKDLSFIAANQGPGPFTTLRVVIATVNGISFATRIPLIGVDGLDVFLNEYKDTQYPVTVALLNAFNQDAYFGIDTFGTREKGCKNSEQLLRELHAQHGNQQIRFIGSGVSTFKEQLTSIFGAQAGSKILIPIPLPDQCSVKALGLHALENWKTHKNLTYQLLPLYLKSQVIKTTHSL